MHDDRTKPVNPKDGVGSAKAPLELLSAVAKVHWALAQFAGKAKYGAWNWRVAGARASVLLGALERHLELWKNGEELAQDDGTHHLGNVMACCAILLEAQYMGILVDDRPPQVDLTQLLEDAKTEVAYLRETYKDKTPKHYSIGDSNEG